MTHKRLLTLPTILSHEGIERLFERIMLKIYLVLLLCPSKNEVPFKIIISL
jgi:hypothetical protein